MRVEKVAPYYQKRGKTGKLYRISGFTRVAKPKAQTGIHPAETRRFEVKYFRDSQGRLVSKRVYRKLR